MIKNLFSSMGPFFSGLLSLCMTIFFVVYWKNRFEENPEDGTMRAIAGLTAIGIIFMWMEVFDSLGAMVPKI